jgi:hypothetical protein
VIPDLFRSRYAAAYLDFEMSFDGHPTVYEPEITAEPSVVDLEDYITAAGFQHTGRISIAGIRSLGRFHGQTLGGASYPWHAFIGAFTLARDMGCQNSLAISRTAMHELGHILVTSIAGDSEREVVDALNDFHFNHGGTASCLYEPGCQDAPLCARHIAVLRDGLGRSFAPWNNGDHAWSGTVFDSGVSRVY